MRYLHWQSGRLAKMRTYRLVAALSRVLVVGLLLATLAGPKPCYATFTTQTSKPTFVDLCERAAQEVKASRDLIASLEKRLATAEEQRAAMAERIALSDEAKATLQEALAAKGEQVAALRDAIAAREEQVKVLEKDLERVRAERDSARRSRWLFGLGGLAVGVALAVAAGSN